MDELYMGTEETQTELETEPDELRDEPVGQTETVDDAASAEDGMDPERANAVPSQSGTQRRRERRARPAPVVSIDDRLGVETDADKARDAMLDLVESLKTRRILSGTVQGIERPGDGANSVAVIYHGDFKVLIPAEEMVEKPEETRGRSVSDALHYIPAERHECERDGQGRPGNGRADRAPLRRGRKLSGTSFERGVHGAAARHKGRRGAPPGGTQAV